MAKKKTVRKSSTEILFSGFNLEIETLETIIRHVYYSDCERFRIIRERSWILSPWSTAIPQAVFELGDLIGADENAPGDALLNQQVAKVSGSQYAIGRVGRREATPSRSVLVDIRSTVMTGGIHS